MSASGATSNLSVTNGTLINASGGTIRTSSSNLNTLQAQLNNQGTVQVDQNLTIDRTGGQHVNASTGIISIGAGKVLAIEGADSTHSFTLDGEIAIDSGGLFQLTGGTFDKTALGNMTGAGRATFTDAVVNLAEDYVAPPDVGLSLIRSVVNGAPTIRCATATSLDGTTVNAKFYNLSGGLLTLQGDATNPESVIQNDPFLFQTSLQNDQGSTILIRPTVAAGAHLRVVDTLGQAVSNSGTITLSSAGVSAPARFTVGNGAGRLTNSGLISILPGFGGTRTISAAITNVSQIDVDANATIGGAGGHFANGSAYGFSTGIVEVAANRTLTLVGSGDPHQNYDLIRVDGTLQAQISSNTTAFANQGLIELHQGSGLSVSGGVFANGSTAYGPGPALPRGIQGSGSISGGSQFENRLLLYPTWINQASIAMLTINTDLSMLQTSGGSLFLAPEVRIDLRGPAPQTEYSILDVNGNAQLRGSLRVNLSPPYDPGVGATFDVLTAGAITGTFDVAYLPGLSGGKYMTVGYGSSMNLVGDPLAPINTVTVSVQTLQNLVGLNQPQNQSLPGPPTAGVLGDFDGDGDQDLAICITASVLVLLNAGSINGVWQGFSGSTQITVGVDPVAIDAGLLDADVALDLAVVNRGSDSLWVLRNNGSGSFSQLGSAIATNESPTSVVIGDLDALPLSLGAGGTADLVVAAVGPDVMMPGSVEVFGNNGAGAFAPIVVIPVGVHPVRVTVGDVDVDRDLDVVAVNMGSGTMSVLENRWQPATSMSARSRVHWPWPTWIWTATSTWWCCKMSPVSPRFRCCATTRHHRLARRW